MTATTASVSVPAARIGRLARVTLAWLHSLVAVTAVAGGVTLIVGSLIGDMSGTLVPAAEYLEGSPFTSYIVPGVLLAGVVGGTQVIAAILAFRGRAFWQVGSGRLVRPGDLGVRADGVHPVQLPPGRVLRVRDRGDRAAAAELRHPVAAAALSARRDGVGGRA